MSAISAIGSQRLPPSLFFNEVKHFGVDIIHSIQREAEVYKNTKWYEFKKPYFFKKTAPIIDIIKDIAAGAIKVGHSISSATHRTVTTIAEAANHVKMNAFKTQSVLGMLSVLSILNLLTNALFTLPGQIRELFLHTYDPYDVLFHVWDLLVTFGELVSDAIDILSGIVDFCLSTFEYVIESQALEVLGEIAPFILIGLLSFVTIQKIAVNIERQIHFNDLVKNPENLKDKIDQLYGIEGEETFSKKQAALKRHTDAKIIKIMGNLQKNLDTMPQSEIDLALKNIKKIHEHTLSTDLVKGAFDVALIAALVASVACPILIPFLLVPIAAGRSIQKLGHWINNNYIFKVSIN